MSPTTYYLVGGHVRDELLGVRSKDVDFAVEADSYETMVHDLVYGRGVQPADIWQERPQFGSVRAKDPILGPADFTLCRRDGFYSDGRRPDSIQVGTIYDDLARRDFTVNAIARRTDGTFLDPHRGREDLAMMRLRCVGDAETRFSEDGLRLLRAMRFHVTRGFTLDDEIVGCLNRLKVLENLASVSTERKYEELKRCYDHDVKRTLAFLREYRWLEAVLFEDPRLGLTPEVRP